MKRRISMFYFQNREYLVSKNKPGQLGECKLTEYLKLVIHLQKYHDRGVFRLTSTSSRDVLLFTLCILTLFPIHLACTS